MDNQSSDDTTGMINRAFNEGDPDAQALVFEKLGQELHRMAARIMAREHDGHTWRPSDVVDEYVVSMLQGQPFTVDDKQQFFGFAHTKMKQLLVDRARHKGSQKAGGNYRRSSLDECQDYIESNRIGDDSVTLAMFNEALERLEIDEPRYFEILIGTIVCHLTPDELAAILDLSKTIVYDEINKARLYLHRELSGKDRSDEL